jgi:hypothetical protein
MKFAPYYMLLLVAGIASCSDKYDPATYFTAPERDSLLADIITYVYVRPSGANWDTRFNLEFRKFYVSQLPKFRFENLYRDESGNYYYFIIRPARSVEGTQRGVGGTFRLDERNKIIRFNEVYVTPVGDLVELRKMGVELFEHMVRTGNVEQYMLNDVYLEWPNAWTDYDTVRHEWLVKPGI